VGNYRANDFGLHDMHGSVREWTQDCWNDSYNGAPSNGRAQTQGGCAKRVVRGGSWYLPPSYLRSADRYKDFASIRASSFGFRLVQDR